jgi:ABC-type polysaccharide/polyol phosphate export permease
VVADLKVTSAESRLGWLWWLVDPLLMMGIYWLFVMVLLGRHHYPRYPIFVGCGLLAWRHFATSAGGAASVLRSYGDEIRSASFPTLVLPLAHLLSQSVFLAASLLALCVAAAAHGVALGWTLLQLMPLLILQVALVGGVCAGLACLGVMVKDLDNFLGHALRVGWYLSPGIYGADLIAERAQSLGWTWLPRLYNLNPFALLFEGYRAALHTPRWLEPSVWLLLAVQALGTLALGYAFYLRHDRRLVKFL